MKQGLVRLLYNLGKVHGVDITHDNVCSSMLSCFYSHLLSTGRPISSLMYYYFHMWRISDMWRILDFLLYIKVVKQNYASDIVLCIVS